MVKFKLKTNPVGQIYLPKEIREELGKELILIANAKVGVIFPTNESLDRILKSLEVILADLKLRLEDQTKN